MYGIRSHNLIAVVRDGTSVNGVAMHAIKIMCPNYIKCPSHILDHAEENFCTPHLTDFTSSWLSLFSHTNLLWKSQTGKAMASYSLTSCWSKCEVQKQIMEYYGDIEPFLRSNTNHGPSLRPKFLMFFDNPPKKAFP